MINLRELLSLPLHENPEIQDRREWQLAEIETVAREFAEADLSQTDQEILDYILNQFLPTEIDERIFSSEDIDRVKNQWLNLTQKYKQYGRDE